jgi:hypothetical protein
VIWKVNALPYNDWTINVRARMTSILIKQNSRRQATTNDKYLDQLMEIDPDGN